MSGQQIHDRESLGLAADDASEPNEVLPLTPPRAVAMPWRQQEPLTPGAVRETRLLPRLVLEGQPELGTESEAAAVID